MCFVKFGENMRKKEKPQRETRRLMQDAGLERNRPGEKVMNRGKVTRSKKLSTLSTADILCIINPVQVILFLNNGQLYKMHPKAKTLYRMHPRVIVISTNLRGPSNT